jgi:hypothetical protein
MARRRIHPRIYPANRPILDSYTCEHPAVRALQLHAEARDLCVGKEIKWPDSANRAVDQSWFSAARCRQQSYSAFAYEFISYDLILDGWLKAAPQPTESEMRFLCDDGPLMRALLDECEEAANADANLEILPLVAKAREFVHAYNDAILHRFAACKISQPLN